MWQLFSIWNLGLDEEPVDMVKDTDSGVIAFGANLVSATCELGDTGQATQSLTFSCVNYS